MIPPVVRIALLWHMHQPFYLDPATGESILPWVRLHALKDYWGMVAILDESPGIQVTFNLVPALVEQVEAYATERTWDRHLVLGLKDAAALDPSEAAWFVREGFHAHAPTMIDPYPRYAELAALAARGGAFDAGALRDLQVWQKLAWVDPDLLGVDPRASRLVEKGRDFDEHDKAALRALELDVLRRVIPAYRAAAAAGHVELSTSPYFHPILPLLCDSSAHHAAHPGAPLPEPPFRHPDDAQLQLTRAVDAHERWFGERPRGVWPSEGGVSDAAAALVAAAGFVWMATDEDILARSSSALAFGPASLYRPHLHETPSGDMRVLFRDHAISDLIGFTYQGWQAESAAADFVGRVREAGRLARSQGATNPVVSVILDGENAWEHYAGGGRPFLRALYRRLAEATDVTSVQMHAAAAGATAPLRSIFAGSWINADFGIWIGHRDDRRAWEQLGAARRHYEARAPQVAPEAAVRALDALLAAEGSDWFWWYGDDHSSTHDREFDGLFRQHVRRCYEALGDEVPTGLLRSNISTGAQRGARLSPGLVAGAASPESYFSRLGGVPLERAGGSMHRVAGRPVVECRIGFTRRGLAIWLDRDAGHSDAVCELEIRPGVGGASAAPGSGTGIDVPALASSKDEVVTVALTAAFTEVCWRALRAADGDRLTIRLVVRDAAGRLVQTMPGDGRERDLVVPEGEVQSQLWRA